ncbi:MAG: fructose-6-phosphate aldolase [Planctomycetes bacterium]|nr:fructose-6-phosphate aldolase [Planctomycetota bacterium]MBM4080980.1 fructose-6-phosphate aldolase [Planctomycetota bacterium]
MKFFLDTASVKEIKEAYSWGILDGVTTNPSHIAKEGRRWREVVDEICELVDGPISVEAVSTEADALIKEARSIARIHKNIVVKIPLIKAGIQATKVLSQEGIKTNVTLNFSPSQALLAAKVGATYISPFVGRLDNIGHFGMELVRQIKTIYDNYGFETEIIVAAARHPLHVLEAALIGADITTMRFEIMQMLFDHPLTDIGLAKFLEDWKKVPQ